MYTRMEELVAVVAYAVCIREPSCSLTLSAYQLGSAAARLLVTSSQVVKP